MLFSSSTMTRSQPTSDSTPHTASTTSVRFARRGSGSPRKRANSTANIRGVQAKGADTYITGIRGRPRSKSGSRRNASSWVLPSWVTAVVLPVPPGPVTINPRRAERW